MLAWLLGPASLLATSRGGSCAVQQQLRLLLGCDTMRIQQGAPAVQLGQRSGWLADCASSVAVAAKERQGRQSEGQVDAQPSQQHGGTQGQGGKGCKARQLLRQAAVALLDGCGGGACSRSQEGAAWEVGAGIGAGPSSPFGQRVARSMGCGGTAVDMPNRGTRCSHAGSQPKHAATAQQPPLTNDASVGAHGRDCAEHKHEDVRSGRQLGG